MSLDRIAAVVGGSVDGDPDVTVTGGAFLDSRDPVPGGLFVALPGEHVDGHDYAAAAVAGGAAAVLAARPAGVPAVVVPDVQEALQQLAAHVLRDLRAANPDLRVVALTGSQGKTSAKDMLAAVLSGAAPTVATYGSFNNELGLPLTVLRAEPTTRFLVLEMGARGIGHLAGLCRIAAPDVSLVLNVGKAHLGEFGSQEAIAQAKGEIVEALGADGVAVLNADDPRVRAMASRTTARVLTFGSGEDADVRLTGLETDDLGRPRFSLNHGTEHADVALRLLGVHQAANANAAAAVAVALGLSLADAAAALGGLERLSRWRMELHERADGVVVVNDAYNANPDSMAAALATLGGIGRRSGRRTVAVLGEMRELGEDSEHEHALVGAAAREEGIDVVLVVGPGARAVHGDDGRSVYVEGVSEAISWVRENVVASDVVLVKASRAAGLERVAEALLQDPENQPDNQPEDEGVRP